MPPAAPMSAQSSGGVEVGTATPNIVVDQPLEAHLESPTVVDSAIAALGDAGGESSAPRRCRKELEAKVLDDPAAAAYARVRARRAVRAPARRRGARRQGVRPRAQRSIRRCARTCGRSAACSIAAALWPNLAEARRRRGRVRARRSRARRSAAREGARRAASPERRRRGAQRARRGDRGSRRSIRACCSSSSASLAQAGDTAGAARCLGAARRGRRAARAQDRLLARGRPRGRRRRRGRARAGGVRQGRAARARTAPAAERVARERLRVAEEHGTPDDVAAAIDALATVLLAAFGPAGPARPECAAGERPTRAPTLRLELVALRRRQAQLARTDAARQGVGAAAAGDRDVAGRADRARRSDRARRGARPLRGPRRARAELAGRRGRSGARDGAVDPARRCAAARRPARSGARAARVARGERAGLHRPDVGRGARCARPRAIRRRSRATLPRGRARRAARHAGSDRVRTPQPDPSAAAALYVQAAELLAYEVAAPTPETPSCSTRRAPRSARRSRRSPDYPAALEALDRARRRDRQRRRRRSRGCARAAEARRAASQARAARARDPARAQPRRSRSGARARARARRARAERARRCAGGSSRRSRSSAATTSARELLAELAADETDATRRGTALLAAARLRERAGAVEPATELYRQVLALWPDDTFARESLIDLLRAQEKWPSSSPSAAPRRARSPDGPAARRALREAAWVLEIRHRRRRVRPRRSTRSGCSRIPDDRAALEGAARCRAGVRRSRRRGRARARTIAEVDRSTDAQWLSRAASSAQASSTRPPSSTARCSRSRGEPSVAATSATLALADLAAARGDTVMRVEATASLAGRTSDPRLGAALAEDSGWMYALVLEDFDRAAAVVRGRDHARSDAPRRAARRRARRRSPQRSAALAQAYEGLARVGADARGRGRAAPARRRDGGGRAAISSSRTSAWPPRAAPHPTTRARCSSSPRPARRRTSRPSRSRSRAVDPLLARAEVLEMRSALADDPAARASWELDRAEALELAGRLREAGAVVAAVLKTRPDDLRALVGAAPDGEARRRQGDRGVGRVSLARRDRRSPRAKLELLREAAAVFDGPGLPHNTDYAVAAYKRILAIDPGAPELERLLELLRERADIRGLIAAISDRLTGSRPRAMARRTTDGAAAARARDRAARPRRYRGGDGGSRRAARSRGRATSRRCGSAPTSRSTPATSTSAVALWRRYLAAETRPQRRGEIELQLSQVLAENTNDIAGAIEQLERVVEAQARGCASCASGCSACACARTTGSARSRELRALARLRPTPQDKAREELRLGLMLRDKLDDRAGARLALDRARTLDPLNLDVVRELAELLEPAARAQVLGVDRRELPRVDRAGAAQRRCSTSGSRRSTRGRPTSTRAGSRSSASRRSATPTADQRQVLAQGRPSAQAPANGRSSTRRRARLLRGDARRAAARAVARDRAGRPGRDRRRRRQARLRARRRDRDQEARRQVRAARDRARVLRHRRRRHLHQRGPQRASRARSPAETPILCLGADVAGRDDAAPSLPARPRGRDARRGRGRRSRDLREGELAVDDRRRAARGRAARPAGARRARRRARTTSIAERAKVLKKELSRKAKGDRRAGRASAADDARRRSRRSARAALAVGHRAGLVWSGDLAVALADPRRRQGRSRAHRQPGGARRSSAWSVSDDHLRLREQARRRAQGNLR